MTGVWTTGAKVIIGVMLGVSDSNDDYSSGCWNVIPFQDYSHMDDWTKQAMATLRLQPLLISAVVIFFSQVKCLFQ